MPWFASGSTYILTVDHITGIGAVVGQPLITALGNGWLFTIVGLFCLIVSNATLVGYKVWGRQWRKSMDKELNKEK